MKRTNLILLCLLAYVPLFSQVDTIADNIFVNNGKLGIGISNPITLLHLNGEVPSGDWRNLVKIHNDTDGPLGFTGIMLKTGSGEGFSVVQDYGINYSGSLPEYDWAGCLGFGNNANGFIFHTPSATGSFKVYTGLNPSTGAGYERLRITPEGDIGIGTSTPDVRLRIEDSIDEGPGRALIRLKNLSTSNTSSVSLGLESNNSENGLGLTFTSEQFSSIPDFDRMGAISVNGKGFSVYSTSNYGSIRFYTNMDQDGIIERMRINHDGNVGIGIKNPLSRLTVNGMIHSTSKGFKFPDGTIQTTAASGGDSSYWNLSGNNIFYNEGNIGIGTSEPRLKLHIRDTSCQLYLGYQPAYDGPYINLLGEVAGDSPILIMGLAQKDYDYSGKTIAKADWAYIYGNNYNHGIGILPDLTEAPEGLYLTRGGLIGIGTTNPVSKLEVKGMIHSTSQGFKFPDGTIQTTAASGGYPSYWNLSGNDIYYSEGNIGIGTSNPISKLEVNGMIHSTSEGVKFPDGTIQTTAASGGDSSYWNLSGNDIYYNEGNIGIGTKEPNTKVEIASGDIFISDINSGIIMKSPDGNCWRGTLDNSGILVFTSIHCPGETQIPINLISTTSKITIFPNPAENTVTIASLDGNFRNTEAIIYTMDGKVVKKNELNGELFIVNISNIPAGSYILRVLNKRGREIGSETILKN
jgi:hypothetical protein